MTSTAVRRMLQGRGIDLRAMTSFEVSCLGVRSGRTHLFTNYASIPWKELRFLSSAGSIPATRFGHIAQLVERYFVKV